MSDFDLDCGPDCCDCDCDPDCCDFDCDCCSCDCSCCNFNCFGGDGDTWIFFSSRTNRTSDTSSFCCCWGGGGVGVTSPHHRTVKADPKPKPKKSRLKRILMFWKTYKENDQEQKPAENQLDDMPRRQYDYHEFGPRGYHPEFGPPRRYHPEFGPPRGYHPEFGPRGYHHEFGPPHGYHHESVPLRNFPNLTKDMEK